MTMLVSCVDRKACTKEAAPCVLSGNVFLVPAIANIATMDLVEQRGPQTPHSSFELSPTCLARAQSPPTARPLACVAGEGRLNRGFQANASLGETSSTQAMTTITQAIFSRLTRCSPTPNAQWPNAGLIF
mmetsp:Transcript_31444/g.46031  ORF Transcript_31444/g.46031 Transcript_31444/m.46031 type:complete len:130 (-) Transcript_31444:36-425(-)